MKYYIFSYIPYLEAIFFILHIICGCAHHGSMHCGFAYLWKIILAALVRCTVGPLVMFGCTFIDMSNTQEATSAHLSNSVAASIWCLKCKHKIDDVMVLYREV